MRGNLTEQDLTDYALNELNDVDRLYVESMLAASEECRADIVATIEMAQLLEQGFERELIVAERKDLALRSEQRGELIKPHFTLRYAIRDVASALGLAASVAFAITSLDRHEFPRARMAADRVAVASTKAADVMTAAVQGPEKLDLAKVLASLRTMAEEGSKLMPVSNDMLAEPAPICTPPTTLLLESAQIASPFGEM
jgi:anti-sigma factor RsiW